MRRQRSQKQIDEHDQPTEPMAAVFFPPSAPTAADNSIPAPAPHEQPFPYQQVSNAYPPYTPNVAPNAPIYPVLPPYASVAPNAPVYPVLPPYASVAPNAPVYPVLPPGPISSKNDKRSTNNASPEDTGNANQVSTSQSKRSAIPLMVGMFFVTVQLLLLVRFVLKLFPISGDAVGMLYTVSAVFVLPFRLLLQNLPLALPDSIELYTLLAILLYGLLSRLLVHFLKALLHSR